MVSTGVAGSEKTCENLCEVSVQVLTVLNWSLSGCDSKQLLVHCIVSNTAKFGETLVKSLVPNIDSKERCGFLENKKVWYESR